MLRNFSNILQRMSKGWIILFFLALFIVTIGGIFPLAGRVLYIPEDAESIDTLFHYTPTRLYAIMETYGSFGRLGYAVQHITADLVFPLVYAFFFATSIAYTFSRAFPGEKRLRWLNLIPFGLALIDLLENLLLIVLLLSYPKQLLLLAYIAGAVTSIKWVAVGITAALPAAGLILWIVRRGRTGNDAAAAAPKQPNQGRIQSILFEEHKMTNTSRNTLVKGLALHHISITTHRMTESLAFYRMCWACKSPMIHRLASAGWYSWTLATAAWWN